MLIERAKVKPPAGGKAQRLYPPPGDDAASTREQTVTVVNLDGAVAVEVLDDASRKAGEGISIAAKGERTFVLSPGDQLYGLVAAGEHEVCVIAGG